MNAPVRLEDGNGSGISQDVIEKDGRNGAYVLTDERRTVSPSLLAFFNPTFGIDMNINAAFSGTPEPVHNGIDSTEWTGSAIVGTDYTFNSTNQANTGTRSVEINAAGVNDIAQFLNPAGSIDFSVTPFVALTLFIRVENNWSAGDSISLYGYDTVGAAQVGSKVLLESFFNETAQGVFQQLTILLTDMNLQSSTIDAFRIQTESRQGTAPLWYIDDWQIEQTGEPVVYQVVPIPDSIFELTNLRVIFADTTPTTLSDGTMPLLDYELFLSEPAKSIGIIFRIISSGEIVFQSQSRQLSDLLSFGSINNLFSTGTKTYIDIDIDFNEITTLRLDSRTFDRMEIILAEDWRGLDLFRVIASVQVEQI